MSETPAPEMPSSQPQIETTLPTVPAPIINEGPQPAPVVEAPTNPNQAQAALEQLAQPEKRYQNNLELISDLRRDALGENPTPEQISQFENSIQGLSLGVLEKFHNLQENIKAPFRYIGTSRSFNLRYGQTGVSLGQYNIDANKKPNTLSGLNEPHISLVAPMSGGDNDLIDNIYSVEVGIKSGELKSGKETITPEQKGRIEAMLRLTKAYYEHVETAIPQAEKLKEMGISPEFVNPDFPNLTQLRYSDKFK